MARRPDLGAYFERLTRRGRGGRRGGGEGRGGITGSVRSRLGRRRRVPPEAVATIEYSPRLDGDPDPGEVVWTWVPYEDDPSQGKDRPVLVIGRRGDRMTGVPLTTKRRPDEAQVALGTGAWDSRRRPSYARIWRVVDLDADRMRREGAVLDRERFDEVVAAVDRYYDVGHATDGG